MCQSQYPFTKTSCKNQYVFIFLILVTSLHLSFELWRSWHHNENSNEKLQVLVRKQRQKKTLWSILDKLTPRHYQWEPVQRPDMNQTGRENINGATTYFLNLHTNQQIHLKVFLWLYCKFVLVCGFNSAKCDFDFFNSSLLLFLVNEPHIEPTVNRTANQFTVF